MGHEVSACFLDIDWRLSIQSSLLRTSAAFFDLWPISIILSGPPLLQGNAHNLLACEARNQISVSSALPAFIRPPLEHTRTHFYPAPCLVLQNDAFSNSPVPLTTC